MKNRTRKSVIRSCSVALVGMMIAGAALIDNGTGLSVISAATASSGIIDVSDKYNTDAIRSQYMNGDAVSVNTSAKNEERWVFVDLGGDTLIDAFEDVTYAATFSDYANTTAAQNLQAQIARSNNAFLKRLSASGIRYEYKYSYSTLMNGVAVKVKNKDIASIRAMNGVQDVYVSESYAVPTVAVSNNANAYSTGIYNTNGIEQKGEGMVVAILDTGLDYTHDAFQQMPSSPKFTEDTVKSALTDLQVYGRDNSLTSSDLYINSKIPFAYDYADDDTDVYPSYSSHGTHVAGIVAGKDDSKIVKYNEEGENETFVGVAPEAQLVIAKVFTDDLDNRSIGGANAIDILAALADCVTLGVDVVNMSLGTTAGFSEEGYGSNVDTLLQTVYEKIEENGISLVTAASNDYSSGFGGAYGTNLASNPDSSTVGSPSTYPGALSVASINGQESNYFYINGDENNVAFLTQSSDANGKAYNFLDLLYEKLGADKSQSLTVKYVVVGGVGRSANYTTSVKRALSDGKTIAVIQRGDISFAEKVQNAMLNGAAACIIYNNVSGTIRMTLGEVTDPIPTCSIGMDAGKQLIESASGNTGSVTFSYEQAAGPFMSDFSSWGPTPDLKIKPEITAHGGEITSAVPGGYAVMSGTSMATPNMSGAIALLRQYAKEAFKNENLTNKQLSERVNQLLMSTATMARNEEGNPYSPRKQGSGLASILDAIRTEAYITADSDGNKPKIELGDDPNKTGVYDFSFTVNSFSDKDLTYTPNVYVMTESLSSDLKTVAEKAYMLTDHATIEITAGGKAVTGTVTVPAGGSLEISVKITLDQTAKDYLNKTFENGMYVEGYVRLTTDDGNSAELGVPYLAFYGDWLKAPLFDYSVYEVKASEADKSVEDKDKLKASASSSQPIGLYDNEQYLITLGSYLYTGMADNYTEILPSDDKAAISCYDIDGKHTVYQLYMLYAGLLRSAKEMKIEITDAASGDVIYDKVETQVRKSYAAGGSNVGSQIILAIDPLSWNLSNNKTYTATFTGELDYKTMPNYSEDREITTERDSYSFSFTIDTEAPRIEDCRIRFEPYTENNVTKYRIYCDVDVYDNQYAMTLLPCYLSEKNELTLITEYPVPIYSQKGGTTTVTYEITDCYEEYVKTGNFYIAAQDYALNESIFWVEKFQDSVQYPDAITLAEDGKLTKGNENAAYPEYNLTLSQYEAYTVEAASGLAPNTAITALNFECEGAVINKDNQLFTTQSSGSGTVTISNARGTVLAKIHVTVAGNKQSDPIIEKITLKPMLDGGNYLVALDGGSISLKPNTERQIFPSVEPWYYTAVYGDVKFTYLSENKDVLTIDENGLIKTIAMGTSYITVGIEGSNLTAGIRVDVDEELDITNNTLYHYYGPAVYVIPDSKNILAIDEEAFKDNTTIEELTLPISLTMLPENCFSGCVNLRKITIPAECTVIKSSAFAGCESLEEIVLIEAEDKITGQPYPGTLTVGRSAFEGCISLTTIENQARITTAFDRAFAGCESLVSIDISGLRTGGNRVFENCTKLQKVTMSSLTHIGSYMFSGCSALDTVTGYSADSIPDYAFAGCESLQTFNYTGGTLNYFGAYAFAGTGLTEFTLPNGTYTVGAHAFDNCAALETVTLSGKSNVTFGSSVFKDSGLKRFAGSSETLAASGALLTSNGGKTLVLAPAAQGAYSLSGIEEIGAGAFAGSHVTSITNYSGVKEIGAYAFAESDLTEVDLSNIAVIPEGAFYKCASLKTVTFSSTNTKIGAYAFAECGKLAQDVVVDNVTEIGASAFRNTPVTWLKGDNISSVGAYAFYGHNISTLNGKTLSLPGIQSLGSYAFARNASGDYGRSMRAVTIGAVQEMGDHVFADCSALRTVEFAEGATVIGAFAFVTADATLESILMDGVDAAFENTALQSVKIPNTVKTIGDFAFLYATALTSAGMDTSGVETFGMGAFWVCKNITKLDFSNALTVGDYAFESSGLTEVTLPKANLVGSYSFASSQLTKLDMSAIRVIGSFAFAGTKLTTLEIPASLDCLVYESTWLRTDDFGEVTVREGRYFYAFGECAFAGISTLQTVTVAAGNDVFFTDEDGVLYGVISGTKENGIYVALLYPAGKTQTEYTVLDNTSRIGDGAFYSATALREIHFPHTVKEIGSFAFFNCNAQAKFYFESVEAPILEGMYNLPSPQSTTEAEFIYYYVFYYGVYYANFYYYVAYNLFGVAQNGALTLVCPENGTGYDSPIWTAFFTETEHSAYAAEDYTLKVGEIISNLTTLSEIRNTLSGLTTDAEKLAYIKALSENEIQVARTAYNKISTDGQREFVAEAYQTLLALESFVRDTLAELGEPVTPVELVREKNPDKITYYVGEKFDPTGLVLKIVYSDGSEVVLGTGDYTIDKTGRLKLTDEYVTFTYTNSGLTFESAISITVTERPAGEGGLGAGAIAGICVGCIAVLGAVAAVVVVLVLKNKKSGGDEKAEDSADGQESAESDENN